MCPNPRMCPTKHYVEKWRKMSYSSNKILFRNIYTTVSQVMRRMFRGGVGDAGDKNQQFHSKTKTKQNKTHLVKQDNLVDN